MHELRAKLLGRPLEIRTKKNLKRAASHDGLDDRMIRRNQPRRDTRAETRHRLLEQRAHVRLNDSVYGVMLINLSEGGAMVEGDFKLPLLSVVDLLLSDDLKAVCTVKWLHSNRAGLEFRAGTDLQCTYAELQELVRGVLLKAGVGMPEASERHVLELQRGAPRRSLVWSATLHHHFHSTKVRLRNISPSGALVDCHEELSLGDQVVLDFGPAGVLDSEVVWCFGDQAGLKFERTFNMSLLSLTTPQVSINNTANDGAPEQLVDLDQLAPNDLQTYMEGFLKR